MKGELVTITFGEHNNVLGEIIGSLPTEFPYSVFQIKITVKGTSLVVVRTENEIERITYCKEHLK